MTTTSEDHRPPTDAAAVRAIEEAAASVKRRIEEICRAPGAAPAEARHLRARPRRQHPGPDRGPGASDRRAIADHETLIALHEMSVQQLDILRSQEAVLGLLDNFASKDMPGKQNHMQDSIDKILAIVSREHN